MASKEMAATTLSAIPMFELANIIGRGSSNTADIPASAWCHVVRHPATSGTRVQATWKMEAAMASTLNQIGRLNVGVNHWIKKILSSGSVIANKKK